MFDFNGLTDFSYNTNFDTNVKIMVLSKKCLSKENNGKTFVYHKNAMRTIRRKAYVQSDSGVNTENERKRQADS